MTRCSDCGAPLGDDGLCAICLLAGGLEPYDPPLPERVGRYRILRLLGSGGMGAVYEAEQEQPRRIVALKLIKPGLVDADLLRRFARESEALARLNHPGIAQIYEAGAADCGYGPQPYFAMELVYGATLNEHSRQHGLDTRQRLELAIRICEAVQHAHDRGIIHRDLKPANILVEESGQCKVLDFGVARFTDSDAGATGRTDTGLLVGTLAYMSPEQVLGDPSAIDTRSDVYTLGVIFYELLAGKLPYPVTRQVYQAAEAIREQDPAPLSSVNRLYRGDIETIVAKAIEKEKARRYASAAELAADIRRYLDDRPVIARPPSTAYQFRKFANRHKTLVIAVAAVFVALVLGIVASTGEAQRARKAEQEARLSEGRALTAEAQAEAARSQAETASEKALQSGAEARRDRDLAFRDRRRADAEAATAKAVNDFLQQDVLAQASNLAQAAPGVKPDPDLKIRTALDRAAQRIEGKFAGQPSVEASIRLTIGHSYLDLGLFPEARNQMERALALRAKILGPRSAEAAEAMAALGQVFARQGKYADAEKLLEEALPIERRSLGPREAQSLAAASDLARVYRLLAKYPQAEKLYAETLDAQRRTLGPQHPDTLRTMSEIATMYDKEGKHDESEQMLAKLVVALRQALGPEHPDTVATMNNLANSYVGQHKYEDAEKLYLEVREIQLRVRGEEHPNTLLTLNNLATVYRDERKFAQSEQTFSRLLVVAPRVFGPEHPRTLAFMNHLAELYQMEGKYKQAQELYQQVFEARKRVLGEKHPDTIKVMDELESVRSKSGQ